jgi:transposase
MNPSPCTRRDLEHRRRLAVQRVLDGYSPTEVADFLDVSPRSVRKWVAAHRQGGDAALNAKPHVGRHPKLADEQEAIVLSWFQKSPTAFGYATELWTARRVAEQIAKHFRVSFNSRYLSAWLSDRGITPQKPQRVPKERDPQKLERWLNDDWPRILKKAPNNWPMSF